MNLTAREPQDVFYEKLAMEKYIGTDAGSQYGAFYLLIYYAKSEHGWRHFAAMNFDMYNACQILYDELLF